MLALEKRALKLGLRQLTEEELRRILDGAIARDPNLNVSSIAVMETWPDGDGHQECYCPMNYALKTPNESKAKDSAELDKQFKESGRPNFDCCIAFSPSEVAAIPESEKKEYQEFFHLEERELQFPDYGFIDGLTALSGYEELATIVREMLEQKDFYKP